MKYQNVISLLGMAGAAVAQEAYEEPTGLNTTLTFVAKITKVVPPTFSDPSSFKTTLVKRASSEVPPAPTQSEPVASSTTLSVAPSIPTNATADGEVLPVKSEFLTQVFANLSCDLDGNINYLLNIPYLSLPFKSHKEKQEITDKVNATFEDIAAHLNKVADVISKATPEQLNLTTVTPEERIPLTAVAKAQSQGAIQTIDDLLGLLTAVPTAVGVAVTIPVAIVTLVPLLVPAAGLFFIIGPLAILLLGVIIIIPALISVTPIEIGLAFTKVLRALVDTVPGLHASADPLTTWLIKHIG